MKWLIYLLLIFNIGFVAWHFRGLDTREESVDALDINNESQLILLSEFQQLQALKQSEGGKLCYSLGPFTNKVEADNAQELLKEENVETKSIRLRDTSRSGYWVILPASESRKEANEHIKKLKKLKVEDYFLVATGSHENAVSLGVYSQKQLARRRVDDMIRLGFIPRMETVALPRKVYWINWYKDSASQPKESTISDFKKHYSQLSNVERSCK
ncbi:MAG: SPOR domain-containing protein [Gammaproteobacteria bacterium]|nr:SPOR domain-containing protein [Gammaproteobacteria bacterium]MCW9031283.1 SPOR domain-containing protein [Gammaproteobacteria bacterium]